MWNQKKDKFNLFVEQKQTHTLKTYDYQAICGNTNKAGTGRGEMDRGFGTGMYTLWNGWPVETCCVAQRTLPYIL